ncbi:HK97 gp10 family phage protein (plasmid) [Exiguobacterium aurantiacum]|uniref:HK97-gp10 family putative phage morphogenesis protein n=2 Tax=Exiguobacterium aurantiacum TaxID=33987 RepID=UPI00384DBA17
MRARMTGVKAVIRNLEQYDKRVETEVAKALRTNILKMEAQAKLLAPVDTGYLRNSIFSTYSGMTATLSAGAEYAMYQEFGTSKMLPQPFFFIAFERQKEQLLADIKKALEG